MREDAEVEAGIDAALAYLLEAVHLSTADDMPVMTARAAALLGASDGRIYVIDYDQTQLIPLLPAGTTCRPVPVEGTLAGRAFSEIALQVSSGSDEVTVWMPLINGTERLGVLQLRCPPNTEVGEPLHRACRLLASLLAEMVMTRTAYGDAIEVARRRLPMSLAAELQWRLLPPLTFATPRVVLSGFLAPTNEVAGDSFDYAVNGDIAHLAVLDAMGHGLEASLLASVAIAALRNARRAGLDLIDSVRSTDKHIAAHFGDEKFLTGIVAELDTRTGLYRWISAGHLPALLLRRGRVVKELTSAAHVPLGLMDDVPVPAQEQLEPGDRLLIYTDGVVEARDVNGEFFGLDRLVEFVTRQAAAGRTAPETLRRLNHAVLSHQMDSLQDDATTLLVEWAGAPERTTPS